MDYSTIDELAEEVTESSSSSNVPGSKSFADIGRLGATGKGWRLLNTGLRGLLF